MANELSVLLLDKMIKTALESLYQELKTTVHNAIPWYRREQEIVSLFAFGHLVPLFTLRAFDTGLMTIEGRVPQICGKKPEEEPKLRGQRDLVIWAERLHGWWRVPDKPDKPLAVMEWKLSTARKTSQGSQDEYNGDIKWLIANREQMQVGYAVLIEWPNSVLAISYTRVHDGTPESFVIDGAGTHSATIVSV